MSTIGESAEMVLKPIGYLDETDQPVIFSSRSWDPTWTAKQVLMGLERAEKCGYEILYIKDPR